MNIQQYFNTLIGDIIRKEYDVNLIIYNARLEVDNDYLRHNYLNYKVEANEELEKFIGKNIQQMYTNDLIYIIINKIRTDLNINVVGFDLLLYDLINCYFYISLPNKEVELIKNKLLVKKLDYLI